MHVEVSCCFGNLRPRMFAIDLLGLLGTIVLDWLTQISPEARPIRKHYPDLSIDRHQYGISTVVSLTHSMVGPNFSVNSKLQVVYATILL